jgi:hypothetical protein
MPSAKQGFNRFRRQMAMARADIDYQGVRCRRQPRQCLPKPLIHSLSNTMFDDRPMRTIYGIDHNLASNVAKNAKMVKIFLAKYSIIFQIQP